MYSIYNHSRATRYSIGNNNNNNNNHNNNNNNNNNNQTLESNKILHWHINRGAYKRAMDPSNRNACSGGNMYVMCACARVGGWTLLDGACVVRIMYVGWRQCVRSARTLSLGALERGNTLMHHCMYRYVCV